ncbi:MAG: hypothetical protein OXG04_26690, partial [Acidobacteria bacterium]|nr:hypothetical protein [Acidobacteriota bacterium]
INTRRACTNEATNSSRGPPGRHTGLAPQAPDRRPPERSKLLEQIGTDPETAQLPAKFRYSLAKLPMMAQNPAHLVMRRPTVQGNVTTGQEVLVSHLRVLHSSTSARKNSPILPDLESDERRVLQVVSQFDFRVEARQVQPAEPKSRNSSSGIDP